MKLLRSTALILFALVSLSTGEILNVEIKVDHPPKSSERLQHTDKGLMYLTLIGSEHQTQKLPLSRKSEIFSPGQVYTYMLTDVPDDLGELVGVYLYWDYDAEWYKPFKWDIWFDPILYVHDMRITVSSNNKIYIMCGSKAPIMAGKENRAFFASSVPCN